MADYNVTVSLGGVAPTTGVYLVTAYGADPTGVADSYSAIQAAINVAGAAGGGAVVLPRGTYAVSQTPTIGDDGVHLVGAGREATQIVPYGTVKNIVGLKILGSSHCSIRDLSANGFLSTTGYAAGATIEGGFYNSIENCAFDGNSNSGIHVTYDETLYWAQTSVQRLVPSTAIDGGGHRVANNHVTGTISGRGIENHRSDRCDIIGNTVSGCSEWGIRVVGTYGTTISGNVVLECKWGVSVQGYSDADIGVTKVSQGVSVCGNAMSNSMANGHGIVVLGCVYGSTFSGNTIRMAANATSIGVWLQHVSLTLNRTYEFLDVAISGNVINGGAYGIFVEGKGIGFTVSDNIVSEFNDVAIFSTTSTGGSTVAALNVSGNIVRTGSGAGTNSLKFGLRFDDVTVTGQYALNLIDATGCTATWYPYFGTSGMSSVANLVNDGIATHSMVYASAAPVSGVHARGDIVFNTAPSASGTIGWVCTSAGTPGTWKTFGAISA